MYEKQTVITVDNVFNRLCVRARSVFRNPYIIALDDRENKQLRYILLTYLLAFSLHSSAQDYGAFYGMSVVETKIDLTENFEGQPESLDALGVGLSVGYLFDFKVITQLGVTVSENLSLFGAVDRYNLKHVDILVGYQARWKKLSFTPKIGYAEWKLNSKEGQLFNPGKEDVKIQSGNDFLWAISLDYSFNNRFALSLSHKNINTDFGGYDLSYIEFLLNI